MIEHIEGKLFKWNGKQYNYWVDIKPSVEKSATGANIHTALEKCSVILNSLSILEFYKPEEIEYKNAYERIEKSMHFLSAEKLI